jgi:hypothetical protein
LKLADFLDNLSPAKFDLSCIVHVDDRNNQQLTKSYAFKEGACGSVGCAIGWCPVVFPRSCKYHKNMYVVSKEDQSIMDFEFAIEHFGISMAQAKYLFMPDAYHRSKRGPKSVASRIRNFVKNNGNVKTNTNAYLLNF